MNQHKAKTPLDEVRFDRLVDGELSEDERRELLTGLDDEPGGWRRCALAFLESQCWKQTFGISGGRATAERNRPTVAVRPLVVKGPNKLGIALAMAACFLMAFWIGSFARQAGVNRSGIGGGLGQVARTDYRPQFSGPNNATNAAPSDHSTSNPWRMVNVSSPGDALHPASSVSVPAEERDKIDQKWLDNVPPAMPENVRQAFARTGHQVEQHRELVSVPLNDGRQAVVPVDQVNVHYVGNNTY